jgi:hypothetical protein
LEERRRLNQLNRCNRRKARQLSNTLLTNKDLHPSNSLHRRTVHCKFNNLFKALLDHINNMGKFLFGLISSIPKALHYLVKSIHKVLRELVNSIHKVLRDLVNSIHKVLRNLVSSIHKAFLKDLPNTKKSRYRLALLLLPRNLPKVVKQLS